MAYVVETLSTWDTDRLLEGEVQNELTYGKEVAVTASLASVPDSVARLRGVSGDYGLSFRTLSNTVCLTAFQPSQVDEAKLRIFHLQFNVGKGFWCGLG